ncbi:MAG TPA: 4'-phosphopantetheinyl transferase superfamily protein [bacterium]
MPLTSPFPPAVAFALRSEADLATAALTPEEERLLGPASSPRRRAHFRLGRACAREALRALGITAPATVGRAADRRPLWPEGFVGSITHSGDHGAAAAARGTDFRGLGVDLERVRLPSDGLLRRTCRPEEQVAWEALPGDGKPVAFTALFAAKESIYKAVNPLTGVYLGFQDATVTFNPGADAQGGSLTWTLHKDSGGAFPAGTRGQGAWRAEGEWVVAGIWIAAP